MALPPQHAELIIWTAVGICTAFKRGSLTMGERTGLLARLSEYNDLGLQHSVATALAENASHEWSKILDIPPWD